MNQHRSAHHKKKVVLGLLVGGAIAAGAAAVLPNSAQAARDMAKDDSARPADSQTEAFSPFVDIADGSPLDLVATAKESGVKHFTVGHLKRATGCAAEGGDDVLAKLEQLRQAGGDVRVSFGGDGGDLTPNCSSAAQLAAAYAKIIDKYKITKVDFDVQGYVLNMPTLNSLRSQAIARLQKSHPGLDVSISLPALPGGFTPNGLKVLAEAKAKSVKISSVNAVTGNPGDTATDGDLLKYTTTAATAAQGQLTSTLGLSQAQAWKALAVTPSIGVNDFGRRTFTLEDAKALVAFANSKHLGRLSMDSINRDKQCQDGAESADGAKPPCSGVQQKPFAFSKALETYRG
ncbi:chitinase [Streptomyces sp. NPDC047082]|uniref:chitinase n=1 Tax=Streptomyces sp. NPDC047082 TaxID=3155259 RepID=UPI0033E5DACD